jgi:tetratricopeptide (TPR) repeat protein
VKKIFFILLFFSFGFSSFSQPGTDEQLAIQFFQNHEYDKALEYYEKLYNKKSTQLYYAPYLNCLLETKDFKKAEKIVRKQMKQNPENLNFAVDLGTVYNRAEQPEKAKSAWEQAVKQVKSDDQVFSTATAFLSIREYDFAIATYLKGRRISANNYPYSFELAEIYKLKGDRLSMINEYLDVLADNDSYIQSVQNALQTSFGNDADSQQNEMLKTELLKRISRSPDKTIFSELLIWMQIQLKDWEGAFVQAKALDKRKKEDGNRLMFLGQVLAENGAFDIAAKAYQYVIAKGRDVYYYTNARMELVNVMYQKIVNRGNYTSADVQELVNNYATALTELGKSASTVPLIKNYAHVLAFYQGKTEEAVKLLEECVEMPQLSAPVQAECKLELGDILLMTGDVWEASLRYSQVEKAFKHDAIGQEAKFRVAKISYYTGDFSWAQAQLDVLKGATSKLIANDAMNLSLLISDALAIDTNTAPLELYALADLYTFQNKDEVAARLLDSINSAYPGHALADDILYKKAQIELKHMRFAEAATFFEAILKDFPEGIIADDAIFKLADLNENQFRNNEKAKELYQQLIEKYPGSLYVVEARKRFRKLRGDAIN